MKSFLLLVLVLPLFLVACGDDQAETLGDSGSESGTLDASSLSYNVYQLLLVNGDEVVIGGNVARPFFKQQGKALRVNGNEVQLYEFASSEDIETTVASISPDGATVNGEAVVWEGAPHFYKTSKVIILYVGDDPSVLNTLENSIGEQFAGS